MNDKERKALLDLLMDLIGDARFVYDDQLEPIDIHAVIEKLNDVFNIDLKS